MSFEGVSPARAAAVWLVSLALTILSIYLVPMARPSSLVEMAEVEARAISANAGRAVTVQEVIARRANSAAHELLVTTARETSLLVTFWCLAAWYLARSRSLTVMLGTASGVLLGMLPGLVLVILRMVLVASTGREPGPAAFTHLPVIGSAAARLTVDSLMWAYVSGLCFAHHWRRRSWGVLVITLGLTAFVKLWPAHLHPR